MIFTITLIVSILVLLNFILLIFSTNKTEKSTSKQPFIIRNGNNNSAESIYTVPSAI